MAPRQTDKQKAAEDEKDPGTDASTAASQGSDEEVVKTAAKRRGQGGTGGTDATAASLADAGAAGTGQGATMLAQGRAQLSGADQTSGAIKIKTEPVEGSDNLVRVTEDVVEEVRTANARRPTHRLVAAAGTILTKAQVEALQTEGDDTGDEG